MTTKSKQKNQSFPCTFTVFMWVAFRMAVCLLLFTPSASGETNPPLKVEEFAYGISLQPMANGAVCRLDAPLDIYSISTRPDLKDIRIFNKRGEAVPSILRSKHRKRPGKKITSALNFFPVQLETGSPGNPLSMQINTNAAGTIISVQSGLPGDTQKAANAYIIDAAGLDKTPVRKLEVNWSSANPSFYVETSLFGSHDLNRWQRLVRSAPLVRLLHGEHKLTRHTISLPVNTYRYFRLEWPKAPEDARITGIKAIQTGQIPDGARLRREVEGNRSSDAGNVFEFDTGGFFPVNYVQVLLSEPNSLIQGVLSSRPDEKSNWRHRSTATFYDLRMGETPLVNEPASVPLNHDRYWRLSVRNRDGGLGQEAPRLEIQWNPNELLFLARGEGPFTLAMGNARPNIPKPSRNLFFTVLEQANKTGAPFAGVKTGERYDLAGPSALEPPKPPFPWKRVILWAVLVAGVGMVGWMAWQLVQQMKDGEDEGKTEK